MTGLLRRVLRLPDAVVLLAQCELRGYRSFDATLALEVIPNAIDAGLDAGAKPLSRSARCLWCTWVAWWTARGCLN